MKRASIIVVLSRALVAVGQTVPFGEAAVDSLDSSPGEVAGSGLPGDFDGDGDFDLYDFTALQICLSVVGPAVPMPPACGVYDSDGDHDVDLPDMAGFVNLFSGPLRTVFVEAGALVPIPPGPEDYYSGEPGTSGNNALDGIAAQAGFMPDDLWYTWSIDSAPPETLEIIVHNIARPTTAFTIPGPLPQGVYSFRLTATNLITGESGSDTVALVVQNCSTAADCDDGDACTIDSCDPLSGCVHIPVVCAACQVCEPLTGLCIAGSGVLLEFTLSQDSLTGTDCDDVLEAPLVFNQPTGTQVPTVQTGDAANGLAGVDTMSATFNFGAPTTVVPTLSDIEILNVTDFGTAATTLHGAGITGLTTLNTLNGTNTNGLVVNNLAALLDVGLINHMAGLRLSYLAAATIGSTDEMTVTLSNVAGGTLNLTSATTNGLETMNIISTGAMNTLASITQTTGTSLTTINKSGDTALTVTAALPNSVLTVNASADTGGLSVDVSPNFGNLTLAGGDGNDTFIVGSNYTAADMIHGDDGMDALGLTSAAAAVVTNQLNVTSIEALTIVDALSAGVTVSRFGAITVVNLQSGFGAPATLTVGSTTAINVGGRTTSIDGTGSGTVSVPGPSTTDLIRFAMNDSDTSGAYIFTGVETLNLSSNNRSDGNAADGGANTIGGALTLTPTFGTGTINLTGTVHLVILGSVTAGTLTATDFTGNLVMSAPSANAMTINAGIGNDVLFGSAFGDLLNGGTGANIFEGLAGVDLVATGTGTDTVRILNAGPNGADRKIVSGFTAGSGGDRINFDSDGLAVLDGTDNFSTAASIQAHGSPGNLTVAAATEIVSVTSGTLANVTDANSLNGTNLLTAIGGTITVQASGNEHVFLIADAAGNTAVYYGDAGADPGISASELSLFAVLQGTTPGGLVSSNFSNAN